MLCGLFSLFIYFAFFSFLYYISTILYDIYFKQFTDVLPFYFFLMFASPFLINQPFFIPPFPFFLIIYKKYTINMTTTTKNRYCKRDGDAEY